VRSAVEALELFSLFIVSLFVYDSLFIGWNLWLLCYINLGIGLEKISSCWLDSTCNLCLAWTRHLFHCHWANSPSRNTARAHDICSSEPTPHHAIQHENAKHHLVIIEPYLLNKINVFFKVGSPMMTNIRKIHMKKTELFFQYFIHAWSYKFNMTQRILNWFAIVVWYPIYWNPVTTLKLDCLPTGYMKFEMCDILVSNIWCE
jgi:hypothetical protein